MNDKIFRRIIRTTLVLVYMVIVAGATVRMTGSGMGCPDWPKCFGYYIPPTDEQELLWSENRSFKKGQVIIKDEKLWVATKDFTTSTTYNPENWQEYTKHDYAIFNPYHTWTEYINRLIGALSGLACLVLFVYSIFYTIKLNKEKTLILQTGFILFLLGFNAWLGATVVYSVLNPVRITLHMFAALITVAALIHLYHRVANKKTRLLFSRSDKRLAWGILILILLQILLGTQVRQFVDTQIETGVENAELWLSTPDIWFYIHRSFSILIMFVVAYQWWLNRKKQWNIPAITVVFALLIIEGLSGILMAYFAFPFSTQAIHLVAAALLFGYQYYATLKINQTSINKN